MLGALRDQNIETMLETLIWQLGEFSGGASFPDDISGVLFEYRGPWL